VLLQDFRISAIAEALEERGGPLDVGEEEGDRPGRQDAHRRPPWETETVGRLVRMTFGGAGGCSWTA